MPGEEAAAEQTGWTVRIVKEEGICQTLTLGCQTEVGEYSFQHRLCGIQDFRIWRDDDGVFNFYICADSKKLQKLRAGFRGQSALVTLTLDTSKNSLFLTTDHPLTAKHAFRALQVMTESMDGTLIKEALSNISRACCQEGKPVVTFKPWNEKSRPMAPGFHREKLGSIRVGLGALMRYFEEHRKSPEKLRSKQASEQASGLTVHPRFRQLKPPTAVTERGASKAATVFHQQRGCGLVIRDTKCPDASASAPTTPTFA